VISFSVTISGKKNRIRVYYLSWLKQKFLNKWSNEQVEKKQGWTNVGELEGAVHFNIGECNNQSQSGGQYLSQSVDGDSRREYNVIF